MHLAPGVLVNEHLRLKRRLGQGGMASVWVAEHLKLRVDVAVKFMAPDLLGQAPDLVARFSREASAIARIRSPHVVQVHDHGVAADGTPFIVMELLEGEDLGARLDREGKLPLATVTLVVGQVAKALARAHAVGIIHRDVKPDNIFLLRTDDEDEIFVKVLDFGIAKHVHRKDASVVTDTGTMVGTPAYMSPEQVLSGKHVDERTDLWSLGVVAYHALTGEVPFEGNTLGALCVAISRGTYQDPSYIEPTLPSTVDAWMRRALRLLPEDRFANAKEMADGLRTAAAAGPLADAEVGPFSRPSSEFGVLRSDATSDSDARKRPAEVVAQDRLEGEDAPTVPDVAPRASAVAAPGQERDPAVHPYARRARRASFFAGASMILLPKSRYLPRKAIAGSVAVIGGVLALASAIRVPATLPRGSEEEAPVEPRSAVPPRRPAATGAPSSPAAAGAPSSPASSGLSLAGPEASASAAASATMAEPPDPGAKPPRRGAMSRPGATTTPGAAAELEPDPAASDAPGKAVDRGF